MAITPLHIALVVLFTVSSPLRCAFSVRNYRPNKDYSAAMNICQLNSDQSSENDMCLNLAVQLYELTSSQRETTSSHLFAKVVVVDDNVTAFVSGQAPLQHKLSKNDPQAKHIALLDFFLVDPAYKGKGYGLLLLNELKNDLQHLGFSVLLAPAKKHNETWRNWFKNLGFALVNADNSRSFVEETLRMNTERFGSKLIKLPLKQEASEIPLILTDAQKESITSHVEDDRKKRFQEFLVKQVIRDAVKTFIVTEPQSLIEPADLLNIVRYYFYPQVTKADIFNFAAQLLEKKTLTTETKKYLLKAIDYVESNHQVLTAAKSEEKIEYPQYQSLRDRTIY